MYKILLLTNGGAEAKKDLRQTLGGKGISVCGKYIFYINETIDDPDFVVIRGKALKQETVFNVASTNTILLTSEPYSVLSYPRNYCKQFALVCSCQDTLRLSNTIYTPAILPWFVGIELGGKQNSIRFNYEDFQQTGVQEKTKLISVITSNKSFTKGHQDRLEFVDKLKKYYGDKLDVFGRGFHGFSDKWDVLAPYKYHISIENSSSKYYWTEKISDCYLSETYPFYYGCTNLNEYFPDGSYTLIDIHDFEQTVRIIDAAIAKHTYENSLKSLSLSKNLVLNEYNMFNLIVSYCEKMDPLAEKEKVKIKPALRYFDIHNFYLHTISRTAFKFKMFVKRFFN